MRNSDRLIRDYPFFAKIIKWLQKPKKFKSQSRTKNWEKFVADENIKVTKIDKGYRLEVEVNWSAIDNKSLDYFFIDYNPLAWGGKLYQIFFYFAYARRRQGLEVSVYDIYKEYDEIDALKSIQHYCYIFMD